MVILPPARAVTDTGIAPPFNTVTVSAPRATTLGAMPVSYSAVHIVPSTESGGVMRSAGMVTPGANKTSTASPPAGSKPRPSSPLCSNSPRISLPDNVCPAGTPSCFKVMRTLPSVTIVLPPESKVSCALTTVTDNAPEVSKRVKVCAVKVKVGTKPSARCATRMVLVTSMTSFDGSMAKNGGLTVMTLDSSIANV